MNYSAVQRHFFKTWFRKILKRKCSKQKNHTWLKWAFSPDVKLPSSTRNCMRTFIYLFSLPDFCAILQRMSLNYDHEIIILSISSSPEVKLTSQALIKTDKLKWKLRVSLSWISMTALAWITWSLSYGKQLQASLIYLLPVCWLFPLRCPCTHSNISIRRKCVVSDHGMVVVARWAKIKYCRTYWFSGIFIQSCL